MSAHNPMTLNVMFRLAYLHRAVKKRMTESDVDQGFGILPHVDTEHLFWETVYTRLRTDGNQVSFVYLESLFEDIFNTFEEPATMPEVPLTAVGWLGVMLSLGLTTEEACEILSEYTDEVGIRDPFKNEVRGGESC